MITKEKVTQFFNEWGNSIVEIGKLNNKPNEQRELTIKVLNKLYGYNDGLDVLFTPTKASEKPFRPTFEGALSYFIAGNPDFPEDHGFAKNPWTKVRFDIKGIQIYGNVAISMGHYFFTDLNNVELKAEYSFAIAENKNGELKIVLHHSSLPFGYKG